MKYLIAVLACTFLFACGDKDEDSGTDTAEVEDSAVESEE